MPRGAYLRRDLPDGHADALLALAYDLEVGADDVNSGSHSRDEADRRHACIDGERLMRRTAEKLRNLGKVGR